MNILEKKTTATLMIAIFMISAFAVAIPVGAQFDPYEQTILDAADRIILGQNNDGGFDWILVTGDSTSYTNLGICAIGVLKAYKIDPRSEFELSLAEAYMYAVNNPPGWVQDGTQWKESPNGVNSWPDVTFMLELARAAAQDSSLLTEIVTLVSGTTVTDIASRAKFLWDDRVNHMGNAHPDETGGSATMMAQYLRDARAPSYPGLIGWDLEAAVKAALALEDYYSETVYGVQADEIADVIYDSIYGTTTYFDINDPYVVCYTLGLAGALEAFIEADVRPGAASDIKDLLIGYQEEDGSWQESDTDPDYIVQATAYAIMALSAQGGIDAQVSLALGVEWLIGAQEPTDGGWKDSVEDEYPEVDSEAAWAIYNYMVPTSYVSMSNELLPPIIPVVSISVTPHVVTFPSVTVGEYSNAPGPVTVENTGDLSVDITVSVAGEGKEFYESTLEAQYDSQGWFDITGLPTETIAFGNSEYVYLRLDTTGAVPGTYEATLVFWAEQTP